MSSSVSGFNGFEQLRCLHNFFNNFNNDEHYCVSKNSNNTFSNDILVLNLKLINIPDQFISRFLLSWSYCLIYHEDSLWLLGYVNQQSNSVKKLKLPSTEKVTQVSCNRIHAICVTEAGGCWQYSLTSDQWKNLGGVLKTQHSTEFAIHEAALKVSCGEKVTAVLTDRGSVYNIPNKLDTQGVRIVDVVCGRCHILMLSERGEVFSVGEGSRGQLGHGQLEDEEEPKLVEGLAGLTVVAVSCGDWHSCALTTDGDLYTWGWNVGGQLGLSCKDPRGKVSVQAIPQVVNWPDEIDVQVSKVACGARHTVTLLDDGSVWGCGWNGYRQLTLDAVDSVDHMTRLPIDGNVQNVICGPWSTCFII